MSKEFEGLGWIVSLDVGSNVILIRNFRITDGLGNSVIRYVENVICKEGQNLPSLSITVIVKLLNYKRPTLEICVSITATIGATPQTTWSDINHNWNYVRQSQFINVKDSLYQIR